MSYIYEVKLARIQLLGERTKDKLKALMIWKEQATQSPEG